MIEVRSSRLKTISIDDGPAMRDVGVVIVDDSAVVVPIVSPVVPTPTEAGKQSNSKSQSKSQPWAVQEKSRIGIPTWEDRQRSSIH